MRESDAWFALAEAYDARVEHDNRSQFLCHWLEDQPDDMRERMKAYLARMAGPGYAAYETGSMYWYRTLAVPATHEEAKAGRVLACLLFGWEARDRERTLVRRRRPSVEGR